MDLARPLLKTIVCSLRSRMSSKLRSNTSSSTAVSCRIPSRLSRSRSCFSIFWRCSVGIPRSERASSLNLESVVLARQSSCLFLSPYCPCSLSSA